MTETTQDLLARLTGFCEQVGVQKCPCGHKSCSQYTLTTQGSVGFALEDADLYAAAPRLHRELTAALARDEALLAALKLALPVLEAAVSFERAAEDYLTESQYELNAALSDPAATIFVNGNDALKAVRAALWVKP